MTSTDQDQILTSITTSLGAVIEPETGADVLRMRLVENIKVDPDGIVSYTFQPSSPLCPIAVFLVQQIKNAVGAVAGVTSQRITVTGYVAAEELTNLINKENYNANRSISRNE
jgi:metal-sulfur cluster biosynthetic enzyme